ncbi:MAG TPA: nuclear transport factor 2 family protein [Dehalococcoidia bacterium]|nr:nuclear transport factor 2 family protein [Dehalococcoidia bacterium]
MSRTIVPALVGSLALLAAIGAAGRAPHRVQAAPPYIAQVTPAPRPPIADPQQLVAAYYQAFAAAVNSGDFGALPAFFTPDAGIDSPLVTGGSGAGGILAFYQKLPPLAGFTIETSNVAESDPYVDVDWRFRAAPGWLRGYLDGHDSFTIEDGLFAYLTQSVDADAAAQAFMPPPSAPPPRGQGVAQTRVRISGFTFMPPVIRVSVGATVTWQNDDADAHTVTTDDTSMDSGVIEEDVSATLTFPAAGDFAYYCTIHPGMRGRVVVGP